MRSFLDVYPHDSLWTTELHEMLLVGSLAHFDLDVARIVERFNWPGVGAALREVGISSPEGLMATWITDRAGLETYAGNARNGPTIGRHPWASSTRASTKPLPKAGPS